MKSNLHTRIEKLECIASPSVGALLLCPHDYIEPASEETLREKIADAVQKQKLIIIITSPNKDRESIESVALARLDSMIEECERQAKPSK